ncbi:MAG: radical SAM protein [Chloroflexota bacterium]
MNPYAGCEHACVYCYARFATRFSHPREPWGSYVDVRENVPEVLERQLMRASPSTVYISSVCDAWQPAEGQFGITRECLKVLLEADFPLFLQTKSSLIERDLDLLSGRTNVTLGVTVTTVRDGYARVFEPHASSPSERLRMVSLARQHGLRTFVFLGPLLPGVSDRGEGLSELCAEVAAAGPDFVLVDRLNRRPGIWRDTRAAVESRCPAFLAEFRRVLFGRDGLYDSQLRARVERAASETGLLDRIEWCF